jgi:ankyrin repeat protein
VAIRMGACFSCGSTCTCKLWNDSLRLSSRYRISRTVRCDRASLAGAPRTLISLKRALHLGPIPGLIVLAVTLTSSALAHGTTIEDAAAAGDVVTLRAMLEANPALAWAKESDGTTPLHLAALYGRKEAVGILLAFHADVAARDENGDTPLHLAAAKGWRELVLVLLANHADVNAKDAHGATPLHAAVFYKREETVKLLIAQHAQIAATDNDGETPLHMAAEAGSVQLAEVLLTNHADINARDTANVTPLHAAVFFKHEDVARLLRDRGGHD